MPNLLAQGAAWLEQQRTKHLTTTVTYVRNDVQIAVPATIGRTKYEAEDGQVVRIEFTDRDFLVLAADLVLNGQVTEPDRGDLIREGPREFEVTSDPSPPIPPLAERSWRSCRQSKTDCPVAGQSASGNCSFPGPAPHKAEPTRGLIGLTAHPRGKHPKAPQPAQLSRPPYGDARAS